VFSITLITPALLIPTLTVIGMFPLTPPKADFAVQTPVYENDPVPFDMVMLDGAPVQVV
jgi:hypothetical protein